MAVHRFPCPSCGKTLKVDDAMLADIRRRGKGAHCPRCKAPVRVAGVGKDRTASMLPPGELPPDLSEPKRGRPAKAKGKRRSE